MCNLLFPRKQGIKFSILFLFFVVLASVSGCGGSNSTAPESFNITGSASVGGSILPTSVSVNAGGSTTFKITPDNGYEIQSVGGCAGSLNGFDYLTGPVNSSCSVNATFKRKSYQISTAIKGSGSATPEIQYVSHNEQAKITINEFPQTKLKQISGCNGSMDGLVYTTAQVTQSCQVAIEFNSLPLVTIVSDQALRLGELNVINSDVTDPDGDLVTYHWSLESAPTGGNAEADEILKAKGPYIHFSPTVPGDYVFGLIVNDGIHNSHKITKKLTASLFSLPPEVWVFHSDIVKMGDIVDMDASGTTDPDNDSFELTWEVVSAPEPVVLDLSTYRHAKFEPRKLGDYKFKVVATDEHGGVSDPVNVNIRAIAPNENGAPVARAGLDQRVDLGKVAVLDGSGSFDAEGDMLNYQWRFVSKPVNSVIEIANDQSQQATFTADVAGDYVVELLVSDGLERSSDTILIKVIGPTVNLYSKDIIFGGYQPARLPFFSSGSREEPANGREQIVLSEFQLVADTAGFVIENLSAVDTTNQVVPQIIGLANGTVLQPNTPLEFRLVSPPTSGRAVTLEFKFNFKGTDLTFYYEVQLKTN